MRMHKVMYGFFYTIISITFSIQLINFSILRAYNKFLEFSLRWLFSQYKRQILNLDISNEKQENDFRLHLHHPLLLSV